MFISITQLHIRSIWKFPALIKHAGASTKQVKQSAGNLSAVSTIKRWYAYTITTWDSKESMMAFRNSGAHKEAMKNMANISDHFRSINYEGEKVPTWKEAFEKLAEAEFRNI